MSAVPVAKPKKARVAKPKAPPKPRKVDRLSTLSLDALSGVTAFLSPLGLLNLSLTCKTLHNTLTSPAAKSLWICSRRQVGLPDLQANDMTEAQYATMMYIKQCSFCPSTKAKFTVDFGLRVRSCMRCQRDVMMYLDDAKSAEPVAQNTLAYRCVVSGWITGCGGGETNHDMRTLHPFWGGGREEPREIVRSSLEMYDAHLDELFPGAKRRSSLERVPAAVKYVERRERYCKKREADGVVLYSWYRRQTKIDEEEHRQALADKKKDIRRRCYELGFTPKEFHYMPHETFVLLRPVENNPKPFTDQTWKTFAKKLVPHLQEQLDNRLHKERERREGDRRSALLPLYKSLQDDKIIENQGLYLPPLKVFFSLDSVRTLWEDSNFDSENVKPPKQARDNDSDSDSDSDSDCDERDLVPWCDLDDAGKAAEVEELRRDDDAQKVKEVDFLTRNMAQVPEIVTDLQDHLSTLISLYAPQVVRAHAHSSTPSPPPPSLSDPPTPIELEQLWAHPLALFTCLPDRYRTCPDPKTCKTLYTFPALLEHLSAPRPIEDENCYAEYFYEDDYTFPYFADSHDQGDEPGDTIDCWMRDGVQGPRWTAAAMEKVRGCVPLEPLKEGEQSVAECPCSEDDKYSRCKRPKTFKFGTTELDIFRHFADRHSFYKARHEVLWSC
ncbi:hypothetical protein RQP46_011373 [Phenoliferia psychrophenolica]